MNLKVVSETLNLGYDGTYGFGQKDNYYFSMIETKQNFINMYYLVFTFDRELNSNEIKEFKKIIKTPIQVFNKNTIKIFTPIDYKFSDKSKDKVESILQESINFFKSIQIKQKLSCHLCNQDSPDTMKVIDGCYFPVHKDCIEKYVAQFEKQVNQEQNNSNLLVSVVLALAGAFVGLIPSIIVLFTMEYLFGILFALIPLASYYGYKLGKGPSRKFLPFLVSGISILSVILFYVFYLNVIAVANGVAFMQLFQVPDILNAIIVEIGQILLFTIIGIFISWQVISRTSADKLKSIHNLK